MLDLVKNISGAANVTFIGHSAGSTVALIYASLLKDHAKTSVKLFIAMAPVSYLKYTKVAVLREFYHLIPVMKVTTLKRTTLRVHFCLHNFLFLKVIINKIGEENFGRIVGFVFRIGVRYAPILFILMIESAQLTPQQIHPVGK